VLKWVSIIHLIPRQKKGVVFLFYFRDSCLLVVYIENYAFALFFRIIDPTGFAIKPKT
jgi:hypothetical protein